MEDVIKKFLSVSDGDGSGNGYGYGNGYGSGYGDGYGDGIKSFDGQKVYIIDNIQTLIDYAHWDYARCRTVNSDLTTKECFVAKFGNFFAHGNTLKEALKDAQEKYNENRPLEERIAVFVKKYPSLDSVGSHSDLYSWHHILTGSCTFGRQEFAKFHNLSWEEGEMTIRDFLTLTKSSFGSEIIQKVINQYK